MSDMIKRDDVLAIIEGRFSGMMIGDILKQDINALPEAEIRIAGRECRIDRCELFNRLATITAEDANEMKAKIYAVIQEMPALPEKAIAHADYCKKRNCVWWSRSLRICFAERNGLVCKYKSGKE